VKHILLLLPLVLSAAVPQQLRFAINGDPKMFDVLMVAESNSETIRYLTAGVLLRVNRTTDVPQPELAESFQVKEGGRAITFKLRPNLQFSDGTPLTAADVERTLRRALDPKSGSPTGDTLRAGDTAPEILVANPREITLRYKAPKPGIDRLFDSVGIAPPVQSKLPPSSGAFFVAEYQPGTFVLLRRNSHYFKRDAKGVQLPYLDSIRLDIQANADIALTRYQRGEFHLINKLDADSFDRLQKTQNNSVRSLGPSLDPEFIWFNQAPAKTLPEWKRAWFTSAAFRHAVSSAIRREDMARIVFKGHAHPAVGPISPANRFWVNAALKPPVLDTKGGLAQLAKEGFTLRGNVLRDKGNHAVEFSLITQAGKRPRERMASLVADDLKALGIKVNVVTLDFGSLLDRISKSLDYEAALLGFENVDADPSEEMNVWLSSGAQHAWWPAQKTPATAWEARIDKLELAQAAEGVRANRKNLVDEFQKIVREEEPIIYLLNPDYLVAVSPSLKGVQPVVVPPQILWNAEWLRFE